MKYSTTLLVLISSCLVFGLALTKPSIAADLEPVLDTDGDELKTGTEYFIRPTIWPPGGLTRGRVIGEPLCPLYVVEDPNEISNGLPATFTPVNSTDGVIRVSTDLNIKFIAPSFCRDSNVWRIRSSPFSGIEWSISTDGVEGNPGCDTFYNWFKIEKAAGYGYKLAFCPYVCNPIGHLCDDIGTYFSSNGQSILSLMNDARQPFNGVQPLNVVFIKNSPLSSVV